jgi:predicted permease
VLLGRTLINLVRLDPGFERQRLITVAFDPLLSGYAPRDTAAMYDRIVAAVQRLPGVSAAAVSTIGILSGDQSISSYMFEGYRPAANERSEIQVNLVGPEYFRTTGINVIAGREFERRDTRRPVAMVNEALARRYFSGTSGPVGKRLGESTLDTEIIGVVRNAAVRGVREPLMPTVYFPLEGTEIARSLDIRVTGDPTALVSSIRDTLRRTEPGLVLTRVETIAEALDESVAGDRRVAYLTMAFAAIALLLACIGLYGVLSYAVVRRTQEIGVRVAVGAAPSHVLRLILADALRIAIGGLVAGLVGAFALRTMLARMLFGVDVADASTYAGVGTALLLIMLAASLIPARRAARVNPIVALRGE